MFAFWYVHLDCSLWVSYYSHYLLVKGIAKTTIHPINLLLENPQSSPLFIYTMVFISPESTTSLMAIKSFHWGSHRSVYASSSVVASTSSVVLRWIYARVGIKYILLLIVTDWLLVSNDNRNRHFFHWAIPSVDFLLLFSCAASYLHIILTSE